MRVQQEVVLNTPGAADGIVRLWADGDLMAEDTGIELRKNKGDGIIGVLRRHRLRAPAARRAGQPAVLPLRDLLALSRRAAPPPALTMASPYQADAVPRRAALGERGDRNAQRLWVSWEKALPDAGPGRGSATTSSAPAHPTRLLLDSYSRAVVDAVDAVAPAVVHVEVAGVRNGRQASGTGSGVVISPDALILTNNHVIEQAKAISVSLADGHKFTARVLGRDADTDLAVLRGETGETLPAAKLANSKHVRAGQIAIAIGNPLGLPVDRHGRHRQRRRPLAARAERAPHRRRHPDRRRAQPRQLGRPARRARPAR